MKGEIKDLVEDDIKKLCEWKKCEVIELNVQEVHIHLLVSVPPKISISYFGCFERNDSSKKRTFLEGAFFTQHTL